tara:strand:- start:266 stop:400 length:135 start_codon:yes stop_codon:yes gene_type:complete
MITKKKEVIVLNEFAKAELKKMEDNELKKKSGSGSDSDSDEDDF